MRIRLHGTPADIASTITALAEVFDIRQARTYHDRPPSTLLRVYLDASPRRTPERR